MIAPHVLVIAKTDRLADRRLREGQRAISIRKLCDRLLAESGMELRVAPPLLLRIAVSDALAQAGDTPDPRFVSALAAALEGFEREEPDEGRLEGSERGRLLLRIAVAVRKSLGEEGFVASDARAMVAALARVGEEGARSFPFFRDLTRIELDGWLRFSSEDLRWIGALQRVCFDAEIAVRIVVPTSDLPLEATREGHPLDQLVDIASRTFEEALWPRSVTLGLARAFVAPSTLSDGERESIQIIRALSPREQAAAARARIEAAVDAGAPLERIGVVLPVRGEGSELAMIAALDEARIPHRGARMPLDEAPILAAITALAEAAFGSEVIPGKLASRYRARAEGRDDVVFAESTRALALAQTRREAIHAVAGWLDALELPRYPLDRARNLLAHDAPHDALATRELAARGREGRAIDGVRTLLRELSEAPARYLDAPASALSVIEIVLQTLSSGPARSGSRSIGVRLGRLDDFEQEELDLLVVLDANEGVFPNSDAPSAFLRPILLPRVAVERALVGEALFALAVTKARALTFVFRAFDGDEPLLPSRLVHDLTKPPLAIPIATARPTSMPVVRLRRGEAEDSSDLARRVAVARTREAFFLDPERRASASIGYVPNLPDAGKQALLEATGGGVRALATTTLETAAKCAFAGYARAALGARSVEEANVLLDRRDEGNLVHRALAVAFEAARELLAASPRVESEVLAVGLAAARSVVVENETFATEVVSGRVLGAVSRELVRAVADEAWTFLAAEQGFGEGVELTSGAGGSWPAFVVPSEAAEETVRLRGKIDRVDVSRADRGAGAPVRVVDYKASAGTVERSTRDVGKTVFQVPLYALAAKKALAARSAEGAYFATSERQPSPSVAKRFVEREKDLYATDDGAPRVARLAAEAVLRVRRGELVPKPEDESACTFCAYDGVCRKPRFAIAPDEEAGST